MMLHEAVMSGRRFTRPGVWRWLVVIIVASVELVVNDTNSTPFHFYVDDLISNDWRVEETNA